MNCYTCRFKGEPDDFGLLRAYEGGILGSMPKTQPDQPRQTNCGTVDIFVCPKCGSLHSDMRGRIENEDRKPLLATKS